MRIVSPVALSALVVVAVQNLADTAVPNSPSGSEPPQRPEENDVANQDKAVKPIKATVTPETLSLQQFAGIQTSFKLDILLQEAPQQAESGQRLRQPLPASMSTLARPILPTAQMAATPEQLELPRLDPLVDTLVNAELNRFPAPDQLAAPAAQPAAPDPAVAAQPIILLPDSPATPTAQPAPNTNTSDIPDYLLPRQAAALGMDRISATERPAASSQSESLSPIKQPIATQIATPTNRLSSEPEVPDYLLPKQAAAVGVDRVTAATQPAPKDYVVEVEPVPAIAEPEPIAVPSPVAPLLAPPIEPTIDGKQAAPIAAEKPLLATPPAQPSRPATLLMNDRLELGGNQSFALSVQKQEDQLVASLSGEATTAAQPTDALPTPIGENIPSGDLARDRPKSLLETVGASPVARLDQEAEYLLGAGDRIRVEVLNIPAYSGEFPVLVNGAVNLPLVGGVPVQGMTLRQASQVITAKYAPLLEQSPITIHLITTRSLSAQQVK